jgi:hypothetical protein
MRLDICGRFVVKVERSVGKFCASCTTGRKKCARRGASTGGAAPPQVNCADERRSPSEGIGHVQVHVAERSSPPSILVEHRGRRIRHGRGHGRAAVGWFARRLLLMPHAPKPFPEVRHCRPDDE